MTPPANGITADVIRDMMPPYRLNIDLLAAMLAAVPPPPPRASVAWRQARCARLVQELAGLMPADAPQARIAAEIVIVHEAIEDTLARAGVAGLAVDQVCRLRRTASTLLASVAALERSLARHQQKPAPFFGTVLADGIDIAAIAAGWGGVGVQGEDGETLDSGGDAAADAEVPMHAGPDKAAAPGEVGIGEIVQRPYGTADGAGRGTAGVGAPGAALALAASLDPVPLFAVQACEERDRRILVRSAVTVQANPAAATAAHEPPDPRQDTGTTPGVVTRLDRGPGWTLDVVCPRKVGDVVPGDGVDGNGVSAVAP